MAFQSHLGLISTPHSHFAPDFPAKAFQSHLGLISTVNNTFSQGQDMTDLSIPSWSDFNEFSEIIAGFVVAGSFQSHLGLISTVSLSDKLPQLVFLSIPPWSDFNSWTKMNRRLPELAFQSHLGLISTDWKSALEAALSEGFQSHLGLISTLQREGEEMEEGGVLSIPSWSDFNCVQFSSIHHKRFLSIPSWSDFNDLWPQIYTLSQ